MSDYTSGAHPETPGPCVDGLVCGTMPDQQGSGAPTPRFLAVEAGWAWIEIVVGREPGPLRQLARDQRNPDQLRLWCQRRRGESADQRETLAMLSISCPVELVVTLASQHQFPCAQSTLQPHPSRQHVTARPWACCAPRY